MSEINAYNAKIAEKLSEIAEILRLQDANPFRIGAYLRAADTIRHLSRPLSNVVDEQGLEGLDELPGIGQTIARLLYHLVKTGRIPMLDRLRGTVDPPTVLASVPGVGRKFAQVLHEDLGIDSLQELEVAAHDGRLARIKGFGAKRIAGIRDSIAARLGRIGRNRDETAAPDPPIPEILDVDREYREKAARGDLFKIAPRRFNPSNEAWLPVLHTVRGEHHYTALFSNTARAHQLGKTDDWVVVYFETDHVQRQFTVINAGHGALSGKRIVRGREAECREYYFGSQTAHGRPPVRMKTTSKSPRDRPKEHSNTRI